MLLFAGCGQSASPTVADDEARKRSLAEGLEIREAARKYFSPSKIDDYFPGMDVLSQVAEPHALLQPPQSEDGQNRLKNQLAAARARPVELSGNEVLGRNTWMLWCAGNEGFWDDLSRAELGFIDLLRLVDSRQRNRRFEESGMINEPGMREARAPDEAGFGMWLDQPADGAISGWRSRYLQRTFDEIRRGVHESQRGLSVDRGDPGTLRDAEDSGGYAVAGYGQDDEAALGSGGSGSRGAVSGVYGQVPPPSIYGLSSGVVGLRLFPNPYFDAAAQARWDATRYYEDETYYRDPELIKPFRVGMSCAFCHASWHPLNPPTDRTSPSWSNISGNIGAQYLRPRATFGNQLTDDNFVYHLLDSQPPGTIDTSLIASDNINNPNTMNAVFRLKERALLSFRNPPEQQSSASANLPSLWATLDPDAAPGRPDPIPPEVRELFVSQGLGDALAASNDPVRAVPRVLLDGADSIGAWGALARVYLNIGSYWERWNQLHQPVLGLTPQQPFKLEDCEQHSVYWHATRNRVGPLRDYFLKASDAMPLLATAGAEERLRPTTDEEVARVAEVRGASPKTIWKQLRAQRVDLSRLAHGRRVFARQCIVCHSSIQPESAIPTFFPGRPDTDPEVSAYRAEFGELASRRMRLRQQWAERGEFWDHDPGQWLQDASYIEWAEQAVERAEFWTWNYLSTDFRIPVTLVGTNPARAMATNAMSGHMWQDFSSESYRQLASPGLMEYFNPYAGVAGAMERFSPRHKSPAGAPANGGGPGYYRVPTLVSIWATAPFLHNNSLGLFNNDPSVSGRLAAFDDGIRKLLWPELRLQSSSYNEATAERLQRDQGLIWRTPRESWLIVSAKNVPAFASRIPAIARLHERLPWLKRVHPLWLPSLILFATALVLLSVSHARRRSRAAWLLVAAGIAYAGVSAFAGAAPQATWLRIVRGIQPPWFVTAVVLAGGGLLLLPLSRYWIRAVSYAAVAGSLLIGLIVYFNAGRLDDLRLGPIPAGTPVNLLANLNAEADAGDLKRAIGVSITGLAEIASRHLPPDETAEMLRKKVAPALLNVNKCPDFVMDKGHDFPWFDAMTDDDKESLIELLKTL
jgi:mono/diheme cytochrome c family protein